MPRLSKPKPIIRKPVVVTPIDELLARSRVFLSELHNTIREALDGPMFPNGWEKKENYTNAAKAMIDSITDKTGDKELKELLEIKPLPLKLRKKIEDAEDNKTREAEEDIDIITDTSVCPPDANENYLFIYLLRDEMRATAIEIFAPAIKPDSPGLLLRLVHSYSVYFMYWNVLFLYFRKISGQLSGRTKDMPFLEISSYSRKMRLLYVIAPNSEKIRNALFSELDRIRLVGLSAITADDRKILSICKEFKQIYMLRENYMAYSSMAKSLLTAPKQSAQWLAEINKFPMTYESDWEECYLNRLEAFYKARVVEWRSILNVPELISRIESAHQFEYMIISRFMLPCARRDSPGTLNLARSTIDKCLICTKEAKDFIYEHPTGFRHLIALQDKKNLQRIIRLYSKEKEFILHLASMYERYVNEKCQVVLKEHQANAITPFALVTRLCEIESESRKTVDYIFENVAAFTSAHRSAIKDAMRAQDGNRFSPVETLAAHLNQIACGQAEKEKLSSDSDLTEHLANCGHLLCFVDEQDTFCEVMKIHLSKRLLSGGQTNNFDMERQILGQLKTSCTAATMYISQMSNMLSDIENTTASAMPEFKEWQEAWGRHLETDLSIQLTNRGFWPTPLMPTANLPPCMAACVTQYKEFYKHKFDKRAIEIPLSLGVATVSANFGDRRNYRIICSTLQAVVLMWFSEQPDGTQTTPGALAEKLGMNPGHVLALLHSMSCVPLKNSKGYILTKQPEPTDGKRSKISSTDQFNVNLDFSSRVVQFKLPNPPLVESDKESMQEQVNRGRKCVLDAIIVRIMKARKTMKNQDLISEVATHTHLFKPDARMIKREIEAMQQGDYLERDENDPTLWHYMA